MIVWRAAKCLRTCVRFANPLSVMLHLRIVRTKNGNSSYNILPGEFKSDSVKSCEVSEAF